MSDFVRDDRSHRKRESDASRARELRDLVVEEIDRPAAIAPWCKRDSHQELLAAVGCRSQLVLDDQLYREGLRAHARGVTVPFKRHAKLPVNAGRFLQRLIQSLRKDLSPVVNDHDERNRVRAFGARADGTGAAEPGDDDTSTTPEDDWPMISASRALRWTRAET